MTLDYLHRSVVPATYTLLPERMATQRATAMLLAIALQESKCIHRRQMGGGPARGFWQFEKDGGVAGVIAHHASRPAIGTVLETLRYPVYADECYRAIEHNDVLACAFARCLLWTLPAALPDRDEPDRAWSQYLDAWRPGTPHPETWAGYFDQAWRVVDAK